MYKTITNIVKSFGADFIPFTTDSEEEKKEMVTDLSGKRKMDADKGGKAKFRTFLSPGYLPVFGNKPRVNISDNKKAENKKQK